MKTNLLVMPITFFITEMLNISYGEPTGNNPKKMLKGIKDSNQPKTQKSKGTAEDIEAELGK